MFNAPVPGQSLTGSPRQFPWERPPELNDPEDVIQMYLTKMNKPEVTKSLMDLVELGTPVATLTQGILRGGVSNGVHSIDVSLIVSPVIHEFLKTTADKLGIPYNEGFVDEDEKAKADRAIRLAKVRRGLRGDFSQTERSSQEPQEAEVNLQQDNQESRGRGFVPRRTEGSVV